MKWLAWSNTFVLLGSSLTMALAVWSAKIDNKKNVGIFITLTFILKRRSSSASKVGNGPPITKNTWCRANILDLIFDPTSRKPRVMIANSMKRWAIPITAIRIWRSTCNCS